ncbi:hypothetical protein ACOTVE_09070 [Campylobacter jejuni]|uniref:hypothetical protein n=1 Tax=Campylobacter jejuni TaxID=197 RepID=UPI003BA25F1C
MDITKLIIENMEKNSRHPELVEQNEKIWEEIKKRESEWVKKSAEILQLSEKTVKKYTESLENIGYDKLVKDSKNEQTFESDLTVLKQMKSLSARGMTGEFAAFMVADGQFKESYRNTEEEEREIAEARATSPEYHKYSRDEDDDHKRLLQQAKKNHNLDFLSVVEDIVNHQKKIQKQNNEIIRLLNEILRSKS